VGLRTGLHAVEKRKNLPMPGIEPWPSNSYPIIVPTKLFLLLFNRHFIEKDFKQKLYIMMPVFNVIY
jgi:hypothetical protein